MNPPTSTTRFIGTPRNAKVLYLGAGLVVFAWLGGAVPWWLALMALCCVGTVRKAVHDVRRYDQWARAWEGMGGRPLGRPARCGCGHPECTDGPAIGGAATPKAHRRGRKASSRWHSVIAAALLLFPIIPYFAESGASEALRNALALLWLATAVYLVCKVILNLRPRRNASVKASPAMPGKAKSADGVEWLLPPASSSPSRAEAEGNLPDYCAALVRR